ncbi:MAG: two-component sensor histidine kinase, partial [Paracoccus sp. (in: a-proteobacteria)]|nr:two-component sensor histidine kinase [Paracoccus sp. (in: a-proteobacteria)]
MSNHIQGPIARTLVPRGLYARAALILFLPVVAVTLVVGVMFLQRHFDGVTRQMTSSMAHELDFVARQIELADDVADARDKAERVADPLSLEFRLPVDPVPQDLRVWYDFSGRIVTEVLRETVPRVISVDLASNERRVNVALMGPFGPYGLSFERRRVSASNPHQLLVLMMFTSLLMSSIATVFLRNQLRPIRRLAFAAEEYGKGRMV